MSICTNVVGNVTILIRLQYIHGNIATSPQVAHGNKMLAKVDTYYLD